MNEGSEIGSIIEFIQGTTKQALESQNPALILDSVKTASQIFIKAPQIMAEYFSDLYTIVIQLINQSNNFNLSWGARLSKYLADMIYGLEFNDDSYNMDFITNVDEVIIDQLYNLYFNFTSFEITGELNEAEIENGNLVYKAAFSGFSILIPILAIRRYDYFIKRDFKRMFESVNKYSLIRKKKRSTFLRFFQMMDQALKISEVNPEIRRKKNLVLTRHGNKVLLRWALILLTKDKDKKRAENLLTTLSTL